MSAQTGLTLRKKQNRRGGVPPAAAAAVSAPDVSRPSDRSSDRSQSRGRRDGAPPESRSRSRPQKNDTTSNLVKKRYSIRYNQLPEGALDAPPMPGMPKIPQKYAQDGRRSKEEARPGSRGGPDSKALYDPNLNADKYIGNFLANSSETEITDFQNKLKKMGGRAQTDLQQNVYHNRTTFISISKEAEKLKTEMQMLRGLMSDLTGTLSQSSTSADTTDFEAASRRRNNRSSVANLEAMWNTQLQALWKNIEGSQKFLAAIPGRHIVMESGHWVELDAATWKNRRGIHIVLLNDHLLVAARKQKRVDANDPKSKRAQIKLVAGRCWPLQELDLVEVQSRSRQVDEALTVRHGQESFTFSSDRGNSQDKLELLQAFRRTQDELRRSERTEKETSKKQDATDYLAARDSAVLNNASLMGTLSKSKDRPEIHIEVDGKQRNLRWVEGLIDDLDIDIALQRFDEAVSSVEKLRNIANGLGQSNVIAKELISVKVDERASKLADTLLARLVATHSCLIPTRSHVRHLTRLSFTPAARTAYLNARSAVIAQRTRQCVFGGDVLAHVTDLAYVTFTLIKNTVSTYGQCFPSSMGGAVVVWAKKELDQFNESLARAVGGLEQGGKAWKECLERAKDLAGALNEVGMDFEGLVGQGLG